MPGIASRLQASPLWLLIRVNALHSWRRIMAIRAQSRLLTGIIGFFVTGYLVLAFELFFHGMEFVAKFPGLGSVLMERLFYTLFAFLFALLLLSNLVISYTNLFRNRETAFLLSLPISTQNIYRWKFIESIILASWAFLFLIAPLLVAFGLVRGVPWHFYPLTVLLIGLFIILPGVFGSVLAIAIGRHLDRRSFQVVLLLIALLLLAFVAFWWKTNHVDDDLLDKRTLEALDRLLARTRFTLFPFLPSYWLASCILQWAEGIVRGAAFLAWSCSAIRSSSAPLPSPVLVIYFMTRPRPSRAAPATIRASRPFNRAKSPAGREFWSFFSTACPSWPPMFVPSP